MDRRDTPERLVRGCGNGMRKGRRRHGEGIVLLASNGGAYNSGWRGDGTGLVSPFLPPTGHTTVDGVGMAWGWFRRSCPQRGQTTVATGGAQRNPWLAEQNEAVPEGGEHAGSRAPPPCSPPLGTWGTVLISTGSAALHPWLLLFGPFGAKAPPPPVIPAQAGIQFLAAAPRAGA